jgi:hypothetical protein
MNEPRVIGAFLFVVHDFRRIRSCHEGTKAQSELNNALTISVKYLRVSFCLCVFVAKIMY